MSVRTTWGYGRVANATERGAFVTDFHIRDTCRLCASADLERLLETKAQLDRIEKMLLVVLYAVTSPEQMKEWMATPLDELKRKLGLE